MEPLVHVVPLIDTDWLSYETCPVEALGRSEGTVPPDEAETLENIRGALRLMREHSGGVCCLTVHTSVLYRDRALRPAYVPLWRECVQSGGELAIHPHEDIGKAGTLYADPAHMHGVIRHMKERMAAHGLAPTAFRGGYFAFSQVLPRILETEGILVDLSSAPGLIRPERDVDWAGAAASAHRLCLVDYRHAGCGDALSQVLEIPLGGSGAGVTFAEHFLFNERSRDLEALIAVWETIRKRARRSERLELVNFLWHAFAMRQPALVERCHRFLEHVQRQGGVFVTPRAARDLWMQRQGDEAGRGCPGGRRGPAGLGIDRATENQVRGACP